MGQIFIHFGLKIVSRLFSLFQKRPKGKTISISTKQPLTINGSNNNIFINIVNVSNNVLNSNNNSKK